MTKRNKQSAIHEATIEDQSIGGVKDAQRREAASERRRLIEVDPSGTLKANEKALKEKVDVYKEDLLGKRKRKSKKWVREIDPNVLLDDKTADNTDKLPSANIMKLIYSHTANHYRGKGILARKSDKDVDATPVIRQDMSYAFDGSSLVCMGLLFEELIAHYTKDLLGEDDVKEDSEDEADSQKNTALQASEIVSAPNTNLSQPSNAKSKKKSSKKKVDRPSNHTTPDVRQQEKTFEPESEDNLSLASDHDENAVRSSPSIPSIRSHSSD